VKIRARREKERGACRSPLGKMLWGSPKGGGPASGVFVFVFQCLLFFFCLMFTSSIAL